VGLGQIRRKIVSSNNNAQQQPTSSSGAEQIGNRTVWWEQPGQTMFGNQIVSVQWGQNQQLNRNARKQPTTGETNNNQGPNNAQYNCTSQSREQNLLFTISNQ